jgi:hypothetical protein
VRVLRVSPACQSALDLGSVSEPSPSQRWWQLPQESRAEVLALLARLIARGVVVEDRSAATPKTGAGVGVRDVVAGDPVTGADLVGSEVGRG